MIRYKNKIQLTLYLDEGLYNAVKTIATVEQRSMNNQLVRLLTLATADKVALTLQDVLERT